MNGVYQEQMALSESLLNITSHSCYHNGRQVLKTKIKE